MFSLVSRQGGHGVVIVFCKGCRRSGAAYLITAPSRKRDERHTRIQLHNISPHWDTPLNLSGPSLLDASRRPQMPVALRETKLTDFFQKRPSLDNPQASSSSTLGSPQSAPCGDPPVAAKRKPGRPKGSGKKGKRNHDQPAHVSSKQSSLSGGGSGRRVPVLVASGSSPGISGPSSKQGPKKTKDGRRKALSHNKEADPWRSSLKTDPHDIPTIVQLFDPASQHRSRVQKTTPNESSSPRALTRSKRRLDDNDDTASVTSSGVPLSLYYTPRQISSPSSSKAPVSPLATDELSSPSSSKRRRLLSRKGPHYHQAPVTPKKARANEIIPTSQSSEVGLYSPIRSNILSQHRNDVQESVENWRHGRSAYRCDIASPLRFAPDGDYSMENENDRPLSPLTTCPNSTSLGSPLSSFTDIDPIPLGVGLDNLPAPPPQHALPTPSSSSKGKSHSPFAQITLPPPVRPVTPPPSSPEPERLTPVPVVPKDSKTRTAQIIAEILANVRAKSLSDDEDVYLHAPLKEQLSSEEEDDEPFWKRKVTTSR